LLGGVSPHGHVWIVRIYRGGVSAKKTNEDPFTTNKNEYNDNHKDTDTDR